MLEIKNLHAECGTKEILKGVNLTVRPGEIHAILGPNGAGKSTLGHVILGNPNFKHTKGDIVFNNESFHNLDPHERAQKGYFLSFQSPPELDGISAKELLFGAKKSLDPEFHSSFRFQKNLKKELQNLHLPEEFEKRNLNKGASGGEKKKMEMVSLLTLNPSLAFLDEIDSGVDIDAIQSIGKAITTFMKQKDKALIIISHTEKLLQKINPTHVHILIDGQIKNSGGPEIIAEVHKKGFKKF